MTMEAHSPAKVPVTLSSASVYPLTVHDAFAIAKDVGYDGLEVLITGNAASQSATALRALMDKYQLPIMAIHAPTLLLTQQVWGSAWAKIERSVILAQAVGASVVVAHPPFRWQGSYAEEFAEGVHRITESTGMKIAVENMYPWRARGREAKMYLPHWNPVPQPYQHVTWDFSHAAIANMDSRQAMEDLGARLAHVHLCDGLDNGKDEHLVPGLGTQRVSESLQYLHESDWEGVIAVEVSTRKAKNAGQKEEWLGNTLQFARDHFNVSKDPKPVAK
ncbi:sugar phosphate isomerase [Arthrobacter sp. YC-RL1]|uniref:Sugar phosphate isomerase/epimerase n=2 Tax=Micrococcales TaxID=85006 RepID=A0A365YDH1_9MICC|nr:sugar phosphate isomerase [Arthrobacter sp. LS16]ALQ30015.1 sugar phosphate isomerase [Arthrobacter sp. YC-RL1]KLI88649.1 sugar phosphate isomerase [Arthrobacter sp. YC-RL1]NAZ17533.1 TIM barrel protein [Glutamicibacter soli]RBM00599.1 sugar phosphate isomerase/epimerase [Glutamicibacter soli]